MVESGDVEEDGATAMRKKLEEECGHGSPPRLPPLIHIECCKSGKVRNELVLLCARVGLLDKYV